jgi:hypothetical protein
MTTNIETKRIKFGFDGGKNTVDPSSHFGSDVHCQKKTYKFLFKSEQQCIKTPRFRTRVAKRVPPNKST